MKDIICYFAMTSEGDMFFVRADCAEKVLEKLQKECPNAEMFWLSTLDEVFNNNMDNNSDVINLTEYFYNYGAEIPFANDFE